MVELAAPAGEPDSLRAAVNCGADAVYLGLSRFNARARAANFGPDDLARAVALCRPRGVRIYLTLNTLATDPELPRVEGMLSEAVSMGVDAVIVQDLGIAALARRLCPDLPLHASTQTSVGTEGGCRLLEELGIERLVLPREASLAQIRRLRESTALQLEAFVHGAQCFSWSGQCTASLARGGRSGNRGACAQPCRLPWDLRLDGEALEGGVPHPLSPGDLVAADRIADLVDAGVDSLKIEGRLKRPAYVASAVMHYRRLLDRLGAGEAATLDPEERRDLLQPFHREPTLGYLDGADHRALVRGRFPGGQGLRVGRIVRSEGRVLELDRAAFPLKAGDGVGIEGEDGGGGPVAAVQELPGGGVRLRMGPDFSAAVAGSGRWLARTDDPALDRRLRLAAEGRSREVEPRRHPVRARISGTEGEPLSLVLDDGEGRITQVHSTLPLEAARTHPLERDTVRARVGKMGDTPFALAGFEFQVHGDLALPPAELNRMRRQACSDLSRERARPPDRIVHAGALDTLSSAPGPADRSAVPGGLTLVCRTVSQVDAALQTGPPSVIIADPPAPGTPGPLIEAARAQGVFAVAALDRSQLPGERSFPRDLWGADAVLVRTLGQLADWTRRRPGPAVAMGDLTLNAVNRLSVAGLLEAGLHTVAPGADLPLPAYRALLDGVPPERIEVPLVLHLPLFHTAHCLYAARLSDAGDRRHCRDVCRDHRLELVDDQGRVHPVLADRHCRNTVVDPRLRDGRSDLAALWGLGLRRFRLELLDEGTAEVRRLLASVQRLLAPLAGDPPPPPTGVH